MYLGAVCFFSLVFLTLMLINLILVNYCIVLNFLVDILNCFPFLILSHVLPRTFYVHIPMSICRNLLGMCLETEIELLAMYIFSATQKLPNFLPEWFYQSHFLEESRGVQVFIALYPHPHRYAILNSTGRKVSVFFALLAKG